MRRLAIRLFLWGLLACSALNVLGTLWLWQRNPAVRAVVDRSAEDFRTAVDRELARTATPDRIADRLRALLAETPRNWSAIDGVAEIATNRAIPLPGDLVARIDKARAEDNGMLARAGGCLACAWNAENCQLSAQLICQAPMVLTPLGDLGGVTGEAWHAARGQPVDRVNLALSVAGLGGALLALPTEGSGAVLGVGANLARMAHRMHLLTAPMGRTLLRAARDGVDWAGFRLLPLGRMVADGGDLAPLRRLLRPGAFAPVVEVARSLGRIEAAAGPVAALHLVRYIDDADDARRLADASEALGPKIVGRIEVLGKSRLLRLTRRLSRFAWGVAVSLAGLIYGAGMLLLHGLQHRLLRHARRAARARLAAPQRGFRIR